jgi:predicted membrane channel-forming protein YqfA (hemolysin III family)
MINYVLFAVLGLCGILCEIIAIMGIKGKFEFPGINRFLIVFPFVLIGLIGVLLFLCGLAIIGVAV